MLTFQNFGLECSVECRCQGGQSADIPLPRLDRDSRRSLTGGSPRVARDCVECDGVLYSPKSCVTWNVLLI